MRYFDSHTHLNNGGLYSDRKNLIQQFAEQGGVGLVNIGVDNDYNILGIEIAQQAHEDFSSLQIGCTVGIHPCSVVERDMNKDAIDGNIGQIVLLLQQHKDMIWGIGECGTDLYRPCTPDQHEMQQYATHRQAEVCQEFGLPLIIHSRSDRAGTYEILKEYCNIVINLHCWNYGPDEIKQSLDTWGDKVYFGYGGIITYPKAQDVRDSLHITPPSQIVLETDAPYLPPQSHRGGINYPHYIVETYQKASEILALELDILCQQVEANWKSLYQRD